MWESIVSLKVTIENRKDSYKCVLKWKFNCYLFINGIGKGESCKWNLYIYASIVCSVFLSLLFRVVWRKRCKENMRVCDDDSDGIKSIAITMEYTHETRHSHQQKPKTSKHMSQRILNDASEISAILCRAIHGSKKLQVVSNEITKKITRSMVCRVCVWFIQSTICKWWCVYIFHIIWTITIEVIFRFA